MQGRSLAGPVLSRAAVRRRRDAGGVRSRFSCERAPTTAHLTAARSPSGECARRRGSRGGAATRSSLVAMAAAAVWREQGGKKWPRVWGGAGVAPFVPARNTAGRPIPDRRPGSRLASWAGKWPTQAEEGDARRAVSAALLLAVGLRAQEEAAEQAAG